MRKHNGMRPQDIPILIKIISFKEKSWQLSDISISLRISLSEVSESLNRSKLANLIDYKKKNINRQNLLEFIEYGIKYVFPQHPGSMSRGIPTAHSHPFMKDKIISEVNYVWSDIKGAEIGLAIEPFYPKQVDGVLEDSIYYKLLALIDVTRVGKVREVKFAIQELKKNILNEPTC